jgi:hypothetical protein
MSDQPQASWNPSLHSASPEHEEDHPLSDRRQRSRSSQDGMERRQFGSNYSELTTAGAELGKAIDSYKVANRRRYVTYDEILLVLGTLGYERRDTASDLAPSDLAPSDLAADGGVALASTAKAHAGLPVQGLTPIEPTSVQSID